MTNFPGLRAIAVTLAVSLCGCGVWLRAHHPPRAEAGLEVPVERIPNDEIEILLDAHGIPTVYADDEAGLVFGLGFMHGRDRGFQIRVLRAAALGRLTELFGERALDADRQLRILSYRLDEATAAIEDRERGLLERYLDGLDAGARHAGTTAEQALLGDKWERLEIRDIVAIARLQSWNLSKDFEAELARARLVARLPVGDERLKAMLIDVPDDGVPIVSRADRAAPLPGSGQPLPTRPGSGPATRTPDGAADRALAFLDRLGLAPRGASNAWAVHGARTESGAPILCNDPHLAHRAPGVFYLARMVTRDGRLDVSGGTFPGLPAVLIGHNARVAWSMTTSYADTQDLVRLEVDPDDPEAYTVDGEARRMTIHAERFTAGDEVLLTEQWADTDFGPVLPAAWDDRKEPGREYALLWTGFDPALAAGQFTAFWDLARAVDLLSARAALEGVPATQSTLLATVDGDIGYHLMGHIPRRARAERLDLPRDGRSEAAGWTGILTPEEKPSATNPERGFLVTANQRIAVDERARATIGGYASTAHRARRIRARLQDMVASGKVSRESLVSVQLDAMSLEASTLAPILARRCPPSVKGQPPSRVRAFCEALAGFDGTYATTAVALPFDRILAALQEEVVSLHVGEDIAVQVARHPFLTEAVEDAVLAEERGDASPLFDDRRTPGHDGLDAFLQRAALRAFERLEAEGRADPQDWRWSEAHQLSLSSPLAAAPLVGGGFRTPARPVSGSARAPRAEAGTPVSHGAVLRMAAEMSQPPRVGFIVDFGQSGHAGHPNFGDLVPMWDRAELLDLSGDRKAVERRAIGSLKLTQKVIIEE